VTPGKAGLTGTGGGPFEAVTGGEGTGDMGLPTLGPLPVSGAAGVSSIGLGEVYLGAVGFMNALAMSNAKPSGTEVGGGGGGGTSSSEMNKLETYVVVCCCLKLPGGGGGGKGVSTAEEKKNK